jgi:pimeloyl-ACP methyl ester carboxylesterase
MDIYMRSFLKGSKILYFYRPVFPAGSKTGMQKKRIKRWIQWGLILYGLGGISIYYLGDYFFFPRVPLPQNHIYQFDAPYREVNIAYDENSNINIIQFTATGEPNRGVVLYFHGNRKNISWYARHVPRMTKAGYEVWMIDYPGYGKSTGKLEEEVLYAYALQLYKLARKKFTPDSLIIYGRSMGTGIATQLASRQPAKRLILETPYYSFSSVGSHFLPIYPMERMMKLKLPTYKYLPDVQIPVHIFHGTNDWTIPYSNAKRLEPLLKKGDEFISVEGASHNNLGEYPLFQKKLDSLLMH